MEITAIVAVFCTAYTIIVARLLVMRAEVYWAPIERPALSLVGRIIQRVKEISYFVVALTCGATSTVVFIVILQWYWSVFW